MLNRLKEIRETKGISQDQLAEISGVSRGTISALENNRLKVSRTSTLTKLADALQEKIVDIFF